jgi:acetyl esterase/lipase
MKSNRLLLTALLCIALSSYAQTPAPAPADPNAETTAPAIDTVPPGLPHVHPIEHKNITYLHASGQDLQLDVYEQPRGQPAPVVVYWHGGAWWKGQRPASGAKALLDMGFSVVNVDYRLTDVAPAPAAVQDVRCSLAWVKKNAAEYHFDLSRVVAYGTSAGGHLALMAGFLPQKNDIDLPECGDVPQVAAVMDYYGIPDFKSIFANGVPLSKSLGRWLGPDPAMVGRMAPVTYLRAGLPPVFIVHGDADPTVPYTQSIALKKSLEDLHVPVTMFSVPGGHHGEFPPDQTLLINEALLQFLRENHILAPMK